MYVSPIIFLVVTFVLLTTCFVKMAACTRPMEALSNKSIQTFKTTVKRRGSISSTTSSVEKSHCKAILPEEFTPTPYSVICGRGRKYIDSIGNRRLAVIASMFIPRYSKASRKEEKTVIVSEIMEIVKDACPNPSWAFIRFWNGRWWEVETVNAREKIGTVLRDCLHDKYKSSTKSKLERRRQRKAHKKALQETPILFAQPMPPAQALHQLLFQQEEQQLKLWGMSVDDASSLVLIGEELEIDNIFE